MKLDEANFYIDSVSAYKEVAIEIYCDYVDEVNKGLIERDEDYETNLSNYLKGLSEILKYVRNKEKHL